MNNKKDGKKSETQDLRKPIDTGPFFMRLLHFVKQGIEGLNDYGSS